MRNRVQNMKEMLNFEIWVLLHHYDISKYKKAKTKTSKTNEQKINHGKMKH